MCVRVWPCFERSVASRRTLLGNHFAESLRGHIRPRLATHKRDKEIGYLNVPGAPSQPASNDDTSVPAIAVASHE